MTRRVKKVVSSMKFQKGHTGYWKGKKRVLSESHRKAISQAKKGKNWNYIDGKSNERKSFRNLIRDTIEYRDWRRKVFERDGYRCVWCGDEVGGNLEADHIIPFAAVIEKLKFEEGVSQLFEKAMSYPLLWDIGNGRTLCKKCHKKTPSWSRCSRSIQK